MRDCIKYASQSFRLLGIEVFLLFVREAAGLTEEEIDKGEKRKAEDRGHQEEEWVALPREQGLERGNQEDDRDLTHCLHQHDDHEGSITAHLCQVDYEALLKEKLYRSSRQNGEGLKCRVQFYQLKEGHKEVTQCN